MRPATPSAKTLLTAGLLLATVTAPLLAAPDASAATTQLVRNGGFEKGVTSWRTNQSYTTLTTTKSAKSGAKAVVVKTRTGTTAVLNDARNTVTATKAGTTYTVSAWVRTDVKRLSGQVRVREVTGSGASTIGKSFWLTDTRWHKVSFKHTTRVDGAQLDLNVLAWNVKKKQKLYVDAVSMTAKAAAKPVAVAAPPVEVAVPATGHALSDGRRMSTRGVPSGSALFGSAVGSNTDPTAFEQQVGQRLGVRRTYWGPGQVSSAVRTARTDLAAGRLPWMSFKLPYSWEQMAAGAGDAWAADLAARMARLPGPVWLAFHHEPEGDGRIADWKKMQERLGPIIRAAGPNVAFTLVLTGWNQLYGPTQYHLDRIWPATKVDVAGFDIYNSYGVVKHGKPFTRHTDMRGAYFEPISAWAKKKGVAWGLAETGYNDQASASDPRWLERTYADLVATGGVAMSYFNTHLHSVTTWVITTPEKRDQFSRAIKKTPMFPRLG